MSIVLSLKQKHFAAVACDGRLSRRRADGGLLAVAEDFHKFRVLTLDIVLAITGSAFIDQRLYRRAFNFVESRMDDENLFQKLAEFLPEQIVPIYKLANESVTGVEGVIVMLLGFDAVGRRIRRLVWQVRGEEFNGDEDDEECSAMGNEDATPLGLKVIEQAARELGPTAPLEKVLPALESAVGLVSDAVPYSVNRNVKSYLIVPGAGDALLDGTTYGRPLNTRLSSGKPLIDFAEAIHLNKNLDNVPNGTRAAWDSTTQKAAAVDAAGNLLIKNVNDVVGSTASPTTSSTTYATIPEMTQTLTFKGNKVLLLFSSAVQIGSIAIGSIAFFKDGTQISQDYTFSPAGSTGSPIIPLAFSFIDSPSAASHTYTVRWKVADVAYTFQAMGTARRFQIVELG